MRVAADSSAMAKRYIEESGSAEFEATLETCTDLALCVIAMPEILSALNRRLREGALTAAQYRRAKRHLVDDCRDCTILNLTPEVIARSTRLLEDHPLRAMDALHLACALEWEADLFVTADTRQLDAARKAGLDVKAVG